MEDPTKNHNYRILLIIGLIALAVATVWVFILQSGKPKPEPSEPSSSASYALGPDEALPWGETVTNPTTRITSGDASFQPTNSAQSSPTATPAPTPSPTASAPSSSRPVSPTPAPTPTTKSNLAIRENTLFTMTDSPVQRANDTKVLAIEETGKTTQLKAIIQQIDVADPDDVVASWNGRALRDEDIVGTGTLLELIGSDGLIADRAVVVVPGDVTGSGQLDDGQLALLKEAIDDPDLLKGAYFLAGDLDSSGTIDIADLRLLAQAIG